LTAAGFLSVALGAGIGAWLRWILSLSYNASLSFLPLGTLIANLIGAFLIGVTVEYLAINPGISPQVRLLIVTGLLGALTTFSTFSLETVNMLMRQQYIFAMANIFAHVFGSILFTLIGIYIVRAVKKIII
tara:strand:+ start:118 stop:510 length:393 start_codon:yes stop_codon:yes gene_type:complete